MHVLMGNGMAPMAEQKRRSAIHPKRAHIHAHENTGDRIADATANAIGSWSFIIVQAAIMAVWVLVNTLVIFQVIRYDSYPFVFLNLAMSAEAAMSAPIIMMSQNRAASRDRKRDDLEASEVEQLFDSHGLLLQINQQQLDILHLLRDQKGIDYLSEKLEQQEHAQNEVLAKVSAVLERKPRTRATRPEVRE